MREGLQRVPSHPTLVKNKAGSDTESGDENVLISVTDDKVAGTHLVMAIDATQLGTTTIPAISQMGMAAICRPNLKR